MARRCCTWLCLPAVMLACDPALRVDDAGGSESAALDGGHAPSTDRDAGLASLLDAGPVVTRDAGRPPDDGGGGSPMVDDGGQASDAGLIEPVEPDAGPPPPMGSVSGRVCSPNGALAVAEAQVSVVAASGAVATTSSGPDGRFTLLDVPPGGQTLFIVKGSFLRVQAVLVESGVETVIPAQDCAVDASVRIALVDGTWDDVPPLLESVGLDAAAIDSYGSDWTTALLADYATLSSYDVVVIECGASEFGFQDDVEGAGVARANLRQFVESGGGLYVSDQAYDVLEQTLPALIDFYGDDATPQSAQKGAMSDPFLADLVDQTLAAAVGSAQAELEYALAAWTVMTSAAPEVRVFARADSLVRVGTFGNETERHENVPHAVGARVGDGRVVFTSAHNDSSTSADWLRVLQFLVFEL